MGEFDRITDAFQASPLFIKLNEIAESGDFSSFD
jgi:hypothetical protein